MRHLKTRSTRQSRLRAEQEIGADDIVQVTEYFHPRAEELLSILPRGLGRWASQRAGVGRLMERLVGGGRRIRTDRLGGFLMLWLSTFTGG